MLGDEPSFYLSVVGLTKATPRSVCLAPRSALQLRIPILRHNAAAA
jgi:hypothetical protein